MEHLFRCSISNSSLERGCPQCCLRFKRITTKALKDSTPFEALLHRKADLSHLRITDCTAFVFVPKELCSKLGATSIKIVLLGYDDATKGYRCYNPLTKKIIINTNVAFMEAQPGQFLSSSLGPDLFEPLFSSDDLTPEAEGNVLCPRGYLVMQRTLYMIIIREFLLTMLILSNLPWLHQRMR